MRSVLACLLVCTLCQLGAGFQSRYLDSVWNSWKRINGKSYLTSGDDKLRKTIFASNYMFIQRHNERYYLGLETYLTGLNQFADLTVKEFFEQYLTLNQSEYSEYWRRLSVEYFLRQHSLESSNGVDWRTKGMVNGVKNQGPCGSCWAFSATGALEGQLKKKTGKLHSLSEQQLVDCSRSEGNNGCKGGLMDSAFDYWMKHGPQLEEDYKYTAKDEVCKFDESKVVGNVTGHKSVRSKCEKQLKEAVTHVGPISIAIDASSLGFQFYRSGVYIDKLCDEDKLNHGVLAVGFDTTADGKDYWIVKNSWGERWGNQGYIWMARNEKNMCGIASMASYPLV